MYKLRKPTDDQLSDYYDAYSIRIQTLMKSLADGTQTIPVTLGQDRTAVHLTLKVQTGSQTCLFLTKYAQEVNLRKLLCGGWEDHLVIIDEVCRQFPNLSWQKRMTKGNYDAGLYTKYGLDAEGKEIVEDFNEIIYWLFVDQLFDGKKDVHLDKKAFVKERDLKICPYCGRVPIDVAEVDGSVSKPYIDHFLPKRKYPFLAMSYMNLIPACHTCNEDANKGDMDPLLYPNHEFRLINPHEFYDAAVKFGYSYNQQGENKEENFRVLSNAENGYLEEGYLQKLKLRNFYSNQTLEVKDVYRRFTTATNSLKKFLYNLGLNKTFLHDMEERTLGYKLNENEAPKRLMYKFRKDLFEQMKREYGM